MAVDGAKASYNALYNVSYQTGTVFWGKLDESGISDRASLAATSA